MTIREKIAREYIKRWLPHMHLAHNPGKHPETREKLNGAVSKNMDADYPMMQDNFDHEEYYERKYGRAKK